jgi:nitrogen-specific signal transduction histidine kinase/CheY-like chemotaxis protein
MMPSLTNKVFETVFNSMSEGLVIHDGNYVAIKYNKKALDILSLTEDQLLGKTPKDEQWVMIREDGSSFPVEDNPVINTIKHKKDHTVIMGIKCGEDLKWIDINSIFHKDGAGNSFAIVIFKDITEDKLSTMQYAQTLDAIGVGFWRLNVKTNELFWDKSMLELYEIRGEHTIDHYKCWKNSVHPDDIEDAEHKLQYAIDNDENFDTVFRIRTPEFKIKYIGAKATIVKDYVGQPLWVLGINWDVTKEKIVEEEVKQLSEIKDNFISTMSHEIRTPLNGIMGMVDILYESVTDKNLKECAKIVKKSTIHLNDLMTDILDLSKLKSNKVILENRKFNIIELTHDVIALHKINLQKNVYIKFRHRLDIGQCFVGDEMRVRQILNNLISNAVKFTPEGNIEVYLHKTANMISIAIKDTGIGISEEIQHEIFSDFFQGDASTTRKYGGTGLGLSITKRLVELLGGCISFNSKKGEGTVFNATLKLQSAECNKNCDVCATKDSFKNKYARHRQEILEYTIKTKKQVLVMEDTPINMDVMEKILSEYELIKACDGKEGIDLFEQYKPDIILIDYYMPNINGREALKYIRERDKDVPIFIITADHKKELEDEMIALGANDFIKKPFIKDYFLEKMNNVIK